jgi:hypothetical protein
MSQFNLPSQTSRTGSEANSEYRVGSSWIRHGLTSSRNAPPTVNGFLSTSSVQSAKARSGRLLHMVTSLYSGNPMSRTAIVGNDDPIVPLINGHILTRLIRGARLQIMQDRHLFFVTKPQETALLVEHFIAEE